MDIVTTPASLFAHLDRLDIRLWADGEHLRYSAPSGALTPDLRALMQAFKGELIVLARQRYLANQPQMGVVIAPPSFAQQHFWTLQEMNPSSCFFNVPYAFQLHGRLDVAALRRSFDEIVRRHDVLRTTLQTIDGALMQVVATTGDADMVVTDLRAVPSADQSDEVSRLIDAELASPFDLASQSCLRVRLLQLSEEAHIMLLCLHSVMSEDGSLVALLKELGVHYEAFLAGRLGTTPAPLPPLPMQYAEYAQWQRSLLTAGMEDRLAYWQEWFAKGEPPPLTPALAKPTPEPSFRAGMVWHQFSADLTRRLKGLSRRAGVTLFVTTVAGYAALLYRSSGCTDVVVGGPVANRSHWKIEPLIGSTLTVVAYRFDLAGDPDVLTLLARVRGTVVAALIHQDVPFASVAALLEPPRQRTDPLFRTALTFSEATPHHQLRLPGVSAMFLEQITNREIRPELFPVMWEDHAAGGALTSYWLYREDMFSADTVRQLVADYESLLIAMADEPTQKLDALPSSRP